MMPIYLDYNASTPIAPEVIAAMQPLLREDFGNPSSQHWAANPAREAVELARGSVARLLGAEVDEIVFTSGGSEANNLALKGVLFHAGGNGRHIVTTRIEHPATLGPCRFLEGLGARVTYVPVDRTGLVDPDAVRRAIRPDTCLISVMHANNEVGTIQPIAELSKIARERGIPVHSDAAQTVGKIPVNVAELGVDLLSVAGHKLYAPKGIGALYVRRGLALEPLVHGAAHESGRRAGTESALLTTALGSACDLAKDWICLPEVHRLRDLFWNTLQSLFDGRVVLNGHPTMRLPNTLNVSFPGHVGADILARMPEVAASTGSACHAGEVRLSPVLEAMGATADVGLGAIRFSLGRNTTEAEIAAVTSRMKRVM